MNIGGKEKDTINITNSRELTINVSDCSHITINLSDMRNFTVNIADAKDFTVNTSGVQKCLNEGVIMARELTKKEMEIILKERISEWSEKVKDNETEYNVNMLIEYYEAYNYVRLHTKLEIKAHFNVLREKYAKESNYSEPINYTRYVIFNYLCLRFGYIERG